MKTFLTTVLTFLLLCIYAHGSVPAVVTDSIRIKISSHKFTSPQEDYLFLNNLYESAVVSDLPSAMYVARYKYSMAEKRKDYLRKSEAAEWIGNVYYKQGLNDSSLIFFNEALKYYTEEGINNRIAEIKNNIANIFRITAKYDTAMVIYSDLLKYYEAERNLTKQGKVLANIGSLYYTAGNQDKGKEYTLKALDIQRDTDDKRGTAVSLVNLSVFALNNGEYAEGIKYGNEALSLLKEVDINYYAAALLRVGYCYYMTAHQDKALDYTREAIGIYKDNGNVSGMMEAYRSLADYLIDMKKYSEALKYGKEALALADTTNRLDLRLLYDILKRAAIYLNMPDEATYYSGEQLRLKEEDLNEEWAGKIAETEAKYEADKKELLIKQLRAERKTRSILLYSALALLAAGGLALWFVNKNQKQKQLLAEQKIRQLEQEKQIAASHALLEGETTERVRLSKDLHDGLGGMLSVAKLKIVNMKGNLTIPEENVAVLNSAIEMLDGSIRELRRVAHNLMPESLIKYGLNAALSDFCRSAEKVNYHFFGKERRLADNIEVTLFRIANELVNNALRHANANAINVQLIIDDERASVVVEDDGIGFDTSLMDSFMGTGLKNLRSRVESFNGTVDFNSSPGKGTEINVEFKC